MQRLEVSGAVRPIYGSLVAKRLSNQALQMFRCLSLEKDQEEMKFVSLRLLVTLYTCIKQYIYNHAWCTSENSEQEILRLVCTTAYGEWEAWLHMTGYIYIE